MRKLLIVCMGNICRSPMAQTVVEKLAANAGLAHQLNVASAGTSASRQGERPDPRVVETLSRRGYELRRIRSRRIAQQDFQHFDLILAMDTSNLSELQRLCPPAHQSKLRLFLEFSEGLNETEVPDPYYGNAQGFERVLDLCEGGANGLIRYLQNTTTAIFHYEAHNSLRDGRR